MASHAGLLAAPLTQPCKHALCYREGAPPGRVALLGARGRPHGHYGGRVCDAAAGLCERRRRRQAAPAALHRARGLMPAGLRHTWHPSARVISSHCDSNMKCSGARKQTDSKRSVSHAALALTGLPRRRPCCCKRRRRARAVGLHFAQVLFQAVWPAHTAADIHACGTRCGDGLCSTQVVEGWAKSGPTRERARCWRENLACAHAVNTLLHHLHTHMLSYQAPGVSTRPARTRHAVCREAARQQPAVGGQRRKACRLLPQLPPVKGLTAAALQAVYHDPVRLPALGVCGSASFGQCRVPQRG